MQYTNFNIQKVLILTDSKDMKIELIEWINIGKNIQKKKSKR